MVDCNLFVDDVSYFNPCFYSLSSVSMPYSSHLLQIHLGCIYYLPTTIGHILGDVLQSVLSVVSVPHNICLNYFGTAY